MPTYEQNKNSLLPEADYPFRVVNAKLKTSRNLNDMIELTLEVDGGAAGQTTVGDHLVFAESSYWKIDAFRIATGEKLGAAGTVSFEPEHCMGRSGRAHFYIDEFEGQQRNKVMQYLRPGAAAPSAAAQVAATKEAVAKAVGRNEQGEPDDIPF